MHKIAILLVTYIGDIKYVERLIPSYIKYNRDNIALYIVVPASDIKAFEKFKNYNIKLLTYESITDNLVHDNSIRGIRPGYINQEIVKLAFWEKGLCENYFCMDSDGQFIKDFYISDFMYDKNTPYTILVEDNELIVEPEYYKRHWVEREKLIRLIQKEIGLVDKRMLTCHGFAILSCKVLESLHKKYLLPKNLTYRDLLSKSPYEFSWYNMWLQKDKTIEIQFREPLMKVFHHKNHHLEYLQKGITLDDIARGYLGVVINSNYSRWDGVVSYEDGNIYELSMKEINILSYKIMRSLLRKPRTLLVKLRAKYLK
ncbi:DUF6492 family protein [Methanomethylovorans sp.]|uniref:DUF6492 family protein n=1 Tax=Methanomethylovorans sp. TaxID=2758717 RepID=UPI001BD2F614|nr:DUF6492 family protein [Methanomethylovorans sp.]